MKRTILFSILISVVIAIGFLHFFTPADKIFFHDTYRRLSYFPIVLGAIWFGVKGGAILAVLSSVAFIPHLLLYAGHGVQNYFSELTEIVLYLCAGIVVGIIAERERRLRIGYQKVSARLEESYEKLHDGAAQLVQAEEQLAAAQKMSALGEMAATLAHEIRNPLSSIRGTAEILLDDYPKGNPKREFVEILLKETGHLETTLKNTLDFSRPETNDWEETASISSLIAKQQMLLGPRLKKEQIQFRCEGLENGDDFLVPESRISQALINLLMNSIEALAENSRRRTVDGEPLSDGKGDRPSPFIKVSLEVTEDGCHVYIGDNGPGIDPDNKEEIFKPFFSSKKKGTGLGLAISRKIVESYGGSLRLVDGDSGGARFELFLPARWSEDYMEQYMLKGRGETGGVPES